MATPAVTLPKMQRQTRRLLDIATPLPPVEGQGNPNRWLEGLTWQARDCQILSIDASPPDPCDANDTVTAAVIGCETWGTADPFRIATMFSGSFMNFNDPAFVAERLQDNYELMVSKYFAKELVNLFADVATAPTNGQALADAAIPVYQAMALMDSTIANRLHGGQGYIHVPPLLLSRAVYYDCCEEVVDGHFVTPAGNIVISDAGYDNAPAGTGGSSDDLTDWIYCSSEVFYGTTTPQLFDPTLYDNHVGATTTAGISRNRYEQYIVGYGILVFDPCPVSGVNATLVEV